MLIPANQLPPGERARCEQNGWIAYDPKKGSTLHKAPEEFQPGKPAKYYLYIPRLMLRVIWAQTDAEAIANANYGGV